MLVNLCKGQSRIVIATFEKPHLKRVLPGAKIYTTIVTPHPHYVQSFGNSNPFIAVGALIELDELTMRPCFNAGLKYSAFYTPGAKQYNVFSYLEELKAKGEDYSEPMIMSDGNGNLFTNLGYWAWARPEYIFGQKQAESSLLHHFAEKLAGLQNAFYLAEDGRPKIGALDLENSALLEKLPFALGGVRIMKEGAPLEITETDPETGRPIILDVIGDLQHIFCRTFTSVEMALKKLCVEPSGLEFDPEGMDFAKYQKFYPDWGAKIYSRKKEIPPQLLLALAGQPVELDLPCPLGDDGHGYKLDPVNQGTIAGTYYYRHPRIRITLPRSKYNHSLILTMKTGKQVALFKTLDEEGKDVRKGMLYEDTALLARFFFQQTEAKIEVSDALVMCNGSEPLLWTKDYQLASYGSTSGTTDRNLSSAILFFRRK